MEKLRLGLESLRKVNIFHSTIWWTSLSWFIHTQADPQPWNVDPLCCQASQESSHSSISCLAPFRSLTGFPFSPDNVLSPTIPNLVLLFPIDSSPYTGQNFLKGFSVRAVLVPLGRKYSINICWILSKIFSTNKTFSMHSIFSSSQCTPGEKQRHHFANKGLSSQSYGFSSSCVWMWELDHKEGWAPKN